MIDFRNQYLVFLLTLNYLLKIEKSKLQNYVNFYIGIDKIQIDIFILLLFINSPPLFFNHLEVLILEQKSVFTLF